MNAHRKCLLTGAMVVGLLTTVGQGWAGGIGNAMIYGPYTGGFGYSYATAYHYNLPFTAAGFYGPWTYPYDWSSVPNNGYAFPARPVHPLFHRGPLTVEPVPNLDLPPDEPPLVTTPQPGMVIVQTPPDAELWFNGAATKQTGPERAFITPPLPPGKRGEYAVRARWVENGKPIEQFRIVTVQAGGQAKVVFAHP
jgi:uncharacterized protein (TIGR03000 family)